MNKHNTIFGPLLALVSRSRFENRVKQHKTKYQAKGLRRWLQFAAMLFGHIAGQHRLRSIEKGMNRQRNRLYHCGVTEHTEVTRSTLSYANNNRNGSLYKSVFETVWENAQRNRVNHGFKCKHPLYSVDATTIDLCLHLFPWADFIANKGGIKLTVKLDHQGKIPCFVIASKAREHDSKQIKEVPFAANDGVVFDRGICRLWLFLALH
jgi:putative transposase